MIQAQWLKLHNLLLYQFYKFAALDGRFGNTIPHYNKLINRALIMKQKHTFRVKKRQVYKNYHEP